MQAHELKEKFNSEVAQKKYPETLSEKLWNVRWEKWFPQSLGDHQYIRISNFDEVNGFLAENYKGIYHDSESQDENYRFLYLETHSAKRGYYGEVADFFVAVVEEKIVGSFIGNISDWSTYYIRSCSVLPKSQGSGFFYEWMQRMAQALGASGHCQRMEAHVTPINHRLIHLMHRLDYTVSGLWNSERWGAKLHFTKYLSHEHEAVFLKQFMHGGKREIKS